MTPGPLERSLTEQAPPRHRRERLVAGGPSQRIQSVDRVVALLQAIARAPHPPSVFDLALECSLNRSTAWRLLGTLEHHGVISRDPLTQGYLIGPEIIRLSSTTGHEPLLRIARPILETYAAELNETLTLAVPDRSEVIYVDQVDPPGASRASWLGKPLALHATSGGKVFLASLGPTELDATLPARLERFTEHTITDREALLAELEQTRKQGYGTCDQEYEEYSSGVAAPIVAYSRAPIAVVGAWIPSQRLPVDEFSTFGHRVAGIAAEISTALAGNGRARVAAAGDRQIPKETSSPASRRGNVRWRT